MQTVTIPSKDFDLVVVGEVNVDLILKGDVAPAFGQIEQIVSEADLVMDSSAVIFACGAARLGLKTAFIGKVGDDLFGKFMIESMQQKGIEISGVVVDRRIKTGFSVILAKPGDRAILTYPGSIPELNFSDIDFGLISRCRHLHLSGFYLLEKLRSSIPELFRRSTGLGLSTSLDTNFDPAGNWDGGLEQSLRLVNVFMPNEQEAMAISRTVSSDDAVQKLSEIVPVLALKLGREGAFVKWKDSAPIKQSAVPVEVIDTVGAGDSFDAGFIYGYLNGWSPENTLRLAVICGSLSTTKPGGTAGQISIDQAMIFMERMGAQANKFQDTI